MLTFLRLGCVCVCVFLQYSCYRDMLEDQIRVEAESQKVLREQQRWVKVIAIVFHAANVDCLTARWA